MERAFMVSKDSEYAQDYDKYLEMAKHQRLFVNRFLNENNIEAKEYHVGGNGLVNCAFKEYDKKEIIFDIVPTKNDFNKFGKMLTKPNKHGLCSFKRNSKIAKDFAQKCIDEQIIINLWRPDIRDYFKSFNYMAYSRQQFKLDQKVYLKVDSEYLKEDDTPIGFTEIKLSEFYKVMEEFKSENK